MIIGQNQPNIKQMEIVSRLQQSEFKFYLTGSRFFGDPRPDSDWDFFCGWDVGIYSFLKSLGFEVIPRVNMLITDKQLYDDDNCAIVYRHECGVDVQFQYNLRKKFMAQQVIAMRYSTKGIVPKEKRRELWNEVYTLIRCVEMAEREWMSDIDNLAAALG